MTSSAPETALKQAQNRARQFLDTNNSLTSKISDEMFSLLEAGEGSFYLRDQLDNILNNIIETGGTRTLGYDRTKLRQLMSIKDKIAYITSIQNTRVITTRGTGPHLIAEDDQIKETLRQVIEELDNRLINNQEFTESWILRHAAINRFSCKVKNEDLIKLNKFGHNIKKLCTDSGFDILAEAVNFTQESDAQKIIKSDEVIKQLSAMGVDIPDNIVADVEKFGEYIKPLRTLDKSYKHLSRTLNMIHETSKTTDKAMITPKQKKQLDEVMNKLELKKTIEDSIINFNKEENLDKNTEHGTPMELLKTIKNSSKFNEIVSEIGIENDFDHWFLSRVTFELTHGAHSLLTKKKSEAFGGDEKKYNEDCNSRRGMMRNRIFEVYDHNNTGESSSTRDFRDNADYERMNSYYTKFPNLFFNKREDNYNNVEGENIADRNALHFDKMRSILAAILRRRVPALRSSDRIRRGSYPKMILQWADTALKGSERGIFNRIQRQIDHADDASILAMTIMFQNQANNKLFYEEKDPFEIKPKWYSKIFKKVAGAEKGRQAVRDKFAPATNFALKATENTVKGALGATAWTAQKGASMINTPLEGFNNWLSQQSSWNPIKLGMIATKPIQWLLNPLSKGIKTGKDGERIAITEALSNGYKAGVDSLPVKEGEEKKTKYLFQWITRGIGSVTEFFGKTVADSGQWMQDQYTVASQKNVLGALYEAGQKEDRWKDLMRGSDLANMLDLRNIGPKLFDDDGRILPVDKPAEKSKEEIEGKKLGEKIKEQLEQLQRGLDDKKSTLEKNIEQSTINNNGTEDRFYDALQRLESRTGDIMSIRTPMESLLPLLKNPTSNDAPIQIAIGNIRASVINPTNTVTTRIDEINNIPANINSCVHQQDIIRQMDIDIRANEATIRANNGNTPAEKIARTTAQDEKASHISEKADAQQQLKILHQELMELRTWQSWLSRITSLCNTIVEVGPPVVTHLDENTLKSLTNSLDLIYYKTTQTTITQQTAANLTGALTP